MKVSLRSALLKIHLWLSLALGLLFVLTCISGSLIIFGPELDKALNPALYRATPGDVGFDRVSATVMGLYPDQPLSLFSPQSVVGQGVYVARLYGAGVEVFLDPGTGDLLGTRKEADSLVQWLTSLHVNLLAEEFGFTAVGIGGILLLIVTLTGCYLWYPFVRHLALAFKIRRTRGTFLFNYDLHKVFGIVSSPLLALITLTGVLFVFYNFASHAIYGLFLQRAPAQLYPDKKSLKSRPGAGARATLAEYIRLAEQELIPGARVTYIDPPLRADETVKLCLRLPESPHPWGRSFVYLDQYSRQVVWMRSERQMSRADSVRINWIMPLHDGSYGGVPMRVLYVLTGFVPLLLLITGVVIWQQHRKAARVAAMKRQKALMPARRLPPTPAQVSEP